MSETILLVEDDVLIRKAPADEPAAWKAMSCCVQEKMASGPPAVRDGRAR